MTKRPIIGINMSMEMIGKSEKFRLSVPIGYLDAVTGASGIPLCLPPSVGMPELRQILKLLDGVVFIGGADYRPEHYGGYPQPANELVEKRQDLFDLELARLVLKESSLPVLGICGGHQLISIAQGGALVQDIRREWDSLRDCPALPHSLNERKDKQGRNFRHPVLLEKDSLIAKVVRTPPGNMLITNSTHHQAVRPQRLGLYLRASAWSSDGVVEAIEPSLDSQWAKAGRFVLGVQWHPEQMQDEEPHRNIFSALIKAAKLK